MLFFPNTVRKPGTGGNRHKLNRRNSCRLSQKSRPGLKSACLKNPYYLFLFERNLIRVLFMVSLVFTSSCLTFVQQGTTALVSGSSRYPHIALPVFYVVVPVPVWYQLNNNTTSLCSRVWSSGSRWRHVKKQMKWTSTMQLLCNVYNHSCCWYITIQIIRMHTYYWRWYRRIILS